jgi:hypothetical protein
MTCNRYSRTQNELHKFYELKDDVKVIRRQTLERIIRLGLANINLLFGVTKHPVLGIDSINGSWIENEPFHLGGGTGLQQ